MATSLEKSKKLNQVNKPLHLSTYPEILVKIGPLASETQVLESRPIKTNKEKTLAEYIARSARLSNYQPLNSAKR